MSSKSYYFFLSCSLVKLIQERPGALPLNVLGIYSGSLSFVFLFCFFSFLFLRTDVSGHLFKFNIINGDDDSSATTIYTTKMAFCLL